MHGEILNLKDYQYGVPFFRKVFTNHKNNNEREIVTLLWKNPQPNIVKIYNVTYSYYDMELLDTDINYSLEATQHMISAKEQLQSLGILYIDWKVDNMGQGQNGIYKLFDFDSSGIIDLNNPTDWFHEPPEFYYYKKAIKNGYRFPLEIDNWIFNSNIYRRSFFGNS